MSLFGDRHRDRPATPLPTDGLSEQDVSRLTAFKWRYSLESHGFSTQDSYRLLFMRWMVQQGKVQRG